MRCNNCCLSAGGHSKGIRNVRCRHRHQPVWTFVELHAQFVRKDDTQCRNCAFSGDNPVAQEIGGVTFDGTGATNWMGVFLNHRPFADYDWFRFNIGIGIGGIEGTLTAQDDENHSYSILYDNNPVGYVGIGFGSRPVKGFTFGFDMGGLHTSGGDVTSTGTTVNAEVMDEIPNTLGYGRVLPNLQLSVAYGF